MQPDLGSHSADLTDVVVLDVRVVAWRSTGPGTIAALQEVFGLDIDTAQRLVSDLPAVVKRGVSATEARDFMAALQSVGAQVVLARSTGPITLDVARAVLQPPAAITDEFLRPLPAALPPPPRSMAARPSQVLPAPPPRSLPNPPRATAMTLQGSTFAPQRPSGVIKAPAQAQPATVSGQALDLLGNDGRRAPASSGGARRRAGSGRLDSAPLFPDSEEQPRLRRAGQRELDLEAPSEPQRLDVALPESDAGYRLPAPQELAAPARLELEPPTPRARPAADSGQALEARRQAAVSNGATQQASRAAAPAHDPNAPRKPSRLVALRQILVSLVVVAVGLWVDDSILRGDASPLGVLLHGFGIYQLGLGLRGVAR